jgi:phospholipase C
LSKLAEEFTVFNRWYSSAPTSTFPNKWFLYSASSGNTNVNPPFDTIEWLKKGYPLKIPSIFDSLRHDNMTWSIHFSNLNKII